MKCNHPNIVKFHNAYHNSEKNMLWIVMEYLEGGTLADAVKAYKFSEAHIAYVSREILKGINYLHEQGFAHRDLKSSNVMLSLDGHIKLIDFGLCADFSGGSRTKMLGSPYWMPPEMILKQPHSLAVDIWSFAVCILELYIGAPPHEGSALKCMLYACTEGLTNAIPNGIDPLCQDFLYQCLVMNPDKRAKAAELSEHPWIIQPNSEEGFIDVICRIFISNYLISL